MDKGEAEVMALGVEKKDSVLILDDKKARMIAKEALDLKITGTLGILIKAKQQGLIPSLKEVLTKLEKSNFRISKVLQKEALKLVGEE